MILIYPFPSTVSTVLFGNVCVKSMDEFFTRFRTCATNCILAFVAEELCSLVKLQRQMILKKRRYIKLNKPFSGFVL